MINDLEGEERIIVSAEVDCWDYQRNGLRVHFGPGLLGFIPEDEITISNLTYKNEIIPVQAKSIIYNFITAEVVDVNIHRREFILSRKSTMKKVFNTFLKYDVINGIITNITNDSIFVDIGAGNIGRISAIEFSEVKFQSLKFAGFSIGDSIKVQIISIDNEKIELSRKSLYESYEKRQDSYQRGDNVNVTIAAVMKDNDDPYYEYAYFVEVEPNVKGLLNSHHKIKYGETTKSRIVSVRDKGLKLKIDS